MFQTIKILSYLGHTLAGLMRKIWFLFPNDELYLRIIYRLEMGHRLDLKNPQTFTEKIQWLKLYDRKPEYTRMVDKITAKEYVSEIIGKEYIIPTLGVWDHFDDIDFSILPDAFVLKTNHGSGGSDVVICRDKTNFDYLGAKRKLERSLKGNCYRRYREWPYKNIVPRIFAEELLDVGGGKHNDITDYKFFCFNGEPKYCQVIQDRHSKETIDFFDMGWRHKEFIGLNPKAVPAEIVPECPKTLNRMIDIARKLSIGKNFARIDLYEVGDTCYFGEITLYPASGFGVFKPAESDKKIGKILEIKNLGKHTIL